MGKEVVKELIQDDFNKNSLIRELKKILDPGHRETIFTQYYELERKLGGTGASKKTATLIFNTIKN